MLFQAIPEDIISLKPAISFEDMLDEETEIKAGARVSGLGVAGAYGELDAVVPLAGEFQQQQAGVAAYVLQIFRAGADGLGVDDPVALHADGDYPAKAFDSFAEAFQEKVNAALGVDKKGRALRN